MQLFLYLHCQDIKEQLRLTPIHNEPFLLRQMVGGDERAFREIFEYYSGKIYAYALNLFHSEETAREMVQDVFLKIWVKKETLKGIVWFEDYLFIVARNHCFNIMRREATHAQVMGEMARSVPGFDNATEETILFNEARRQLQAAIDSLPPRQREVFILCYEQGLKREEAAQQLQVSPETIKSQLKLAVGYVRKRLGGNEHASLLLLMISCMHNSANL